MSRVSDKPYLLYVLWSDSGRRFYIGISQDPAQRLHQHNHGHHRNWTTRYRPWGLIHEERFPNYRPSAPPQTFLVDGTTWFVQEGQLVGPCCEACRVQAMARPLPAKADEEARYELCCPRCGQVPVRRAFTLQELLDLERVAALAWERSRASAPLALSSRPR